MKALILPFLLLCAASSFAQTTFVVEKRGKPAKNVTVYHHKRQVAKTDSLGKATVSAKIVKGDTIRFYDSWYRASYVAEENHTKPGIISIKLQEVPTSGTSQPAKPNPTNNEEIITFDRMGDLVQSMPDAVPEKEPASVYTVVDEPASFPGGPDALKTFLAKNLQYPEAARSKSIDGKCFVQFTVDAEGSISDIRIMRGVPDCRECDMQAVRVVRMMPKWKPGTIGGKAVRSVFNLPVRFSPN